MNVNILAIDSNLAAATYASPSPSKSELNTKDARFALTLDGEKAEIKTPEKSTPDNIKEKAQNSHKPVSNSPQESKESIDNKTKSDKGPNQSRDPDLTPPSGQTSAGIAPFGRPNIDNKSGQPHWIAPTLAEIIHGLAATEVKPSLQFAHITTNAQSKSASATGQAVKSTEIKLLHTTEKGQLGIKTILPVNSNGQNGLKVITPELAKNIPAGKNQLQTAGNNEKSVVSVKTTGLTDKVNNKEPAPETSSNSGKSTNATAVKPPVMNLNLTTAQDKVSETKSNSRQVEPEKLKLTAETDAKTKKSQISNLSNPNSKESIPAGNNISESRSAQKLAAATIQVAAGQTKDQSSSASNKSPSQGFEQMLSHNNSQTLITEQTSVPAKNAAAANPQNPSQNNTSADIGRQILESVQSSMSRQTAEHQITVRLNPPELGKVLIRFQQQENELTGLMEVNKTQTRIEIEQALPQIIRNLADCGIHIRRLEVTLSNDQQPGQGTLGNQSLQNGGAQQQYSANQDPTGSDSASSRHNEWLTGSNSYENLSELQETLIADGSINMLV
jgi:flagellar hook-length control protein FliK